jgi:hypothetical protein
MGPEITLGVAVELPEGVYNVVEQRQYSGLSLKWWLWTLDDGKGGQALLARVGADFYRPRWEVASARVDDAPPEVDGVQYTLRRHGEARAEHSGAAGHDFWLARFRQYEASGRVLIETEDRGVSHRLLGEALEASLVQVYR